MTTLLAIGVSMLVAIMMTRLAKLVSLPAVTAYLVAGILVGPCCLGLLGVEGLGFVSEEALARVSIISDVALGFIAFAIGNEFRLSQLKKTGKQATVIGILQAVAATVLVDVVLIIIHFLMPDKLSLSAALVLGAIAAATAPAATLMVVRQYKAKGPLTDLLLPIVALDDAVGLIIFAISFGIAQALQTGSVSAVSIIVNPLLEIVCSLVLGSVLGWLLSLIEKLFHSRSKRMSICIILVILTVGLSMMEFEFGELKIGFSSLLVCMMLGTVFVNLCETSEELMDRVDGWTTPLFILFFTMSGAELQLGVFRDPTIVLIGITFLIARSLGKYIGAAASAKLVKCSPNIVKYLGITLLPQAGVALGMSAQAAAVLVNGDGTLVRNIVLFAVMIYELIGPALTKMALTTAGEIQPEGRTSARGVIPPRGNALNSK